MVALDRGQLFIIEPTWTPCNPSLHHLATNKLTSLGSFFSSLFFTFGLSRRSSNLDLVSVCITLIVVFLECVYFGLEVPIIGHFHDYAKTQSVFFKKSLLVTYYVWMPKLSY